jgi:hypothetical protein
MNRTKLKNYAPQARKDFIQAVTDRAALFGLTEKKTEPMTERGDVVVIEGREYPGSVAAKRRALGETVKRQGFSRTMEAMAYTWFNRLVAIRFMELHGYLDHGYRVLSHPEGKPTPEILEQAEHVDFPGLKKDTVIDLKLAGNRESELYRLLLTAQCNALNAAMPFLFEKIDDETELLLPDNLLNSDSLIRKLVNEIDEDDWREVEIIGWLYQFYISERKDEVIGKVVASEDIPAATQLFTPNWIVKYLVQNTLGRHWLATYPESGLRAQMEYYIEPAEQTPEVQEQLRAITPTSLNPEELTLLDPACGSGHILVEAYDLFKAIYTERGYNKREIPRLILCKNLYGLEIDDRAAQLAAFALMMKARADDRRIFQSDAKPNVIAFQESNGLDAAAITYALNSPIFKGEEPPKEFLFEEMEDEKTPLFSREALAEKGHVSQRDIAALLELFENAKTFGSLIQVPAKLAAKLPEIENRLDEVLKHGDMTHLPALIIRPLLPQIRLLNKRYDVVVENPPYCGSRYLNFLLSSLAKARFNSAKTDLFAMFVLRSKDLTSSNGYLGVICPFVWMYLASYKTFRRSLLEQGTFLSMVRLEYNAFEPACVPVSTWIFCPTNWFGYKTTVIDLTEFKGHETQSPKTLEAIHCLEVAHRFTTDCSSFLDIESAPFAYTLSPKIKSTFRRFPKLGEFVDFARSFNKTANNNLYVRLWWEVSSNKFGIGKKWVLYAKGGGFRKWWGLLEDVVDWSEEARHFYKTNKTSSLLESSYWFRLGVTYSEITSTQVTFRWMPEGCIYDMAGPAFHPKENCSNEFLLGVCNTVFADKIFDVLNPTLHLQASDVKSLPFPCIQHKQVDSVVRDCVALARRDWDYFEISCDFDFPPLFHQRAVNLQETQGSIEGEFFSRRLRMKELEEENNRLFIEAYNLQDELSPEVPDDQITLYRPDRLEDIKRLISYSIGCMMGRYSLDQPGLIYAHGGNEGFDHEQYKTFRADDDGIVPLLDADWGIRDDATERFVEFISVAWPKEHLEENLKFVSDSLGASNGEPPRDAIRHYLATGFYKHHLAMYKRRPIYWLFSSGKQRAFQCLVYLHRYNDGTLARMRTEYVIPLQGKIAARIEQLEDDKTKATSTSHRKKLQKEQDELKKRQVELLTFDEKLKHYADMRISLDLDDGVKVNYGKFGDLLAEVKAVTGGKDDE